VGVEPAPGLGATPGGLPAAGGFVLPLAGSAPVLRGFAPGPQPWSPGHRGVDLGAAAQTPVLAAGAGRVTFAGVIAGQGVVVIEHDTRLRTTYEPVTVTVAVGQVVAAGQLIGTLQPGVRHGSSGPCLHWGARIGDGYLDPLLLLRRRHVPPVLLPVTGSPG
jgi:murein DD-endopeptidase MepM/ murein hydrolase activator NlpD